VIGLIALSKILIQLIKKFDLEMKITILSQYAISGDGVSSSTKRGI
jgi:hypothetical protein